MTKFFMTFAAALALSSCATTPPLSTPSGKPEVLIEGKTRQQVAEAIADGCMRAGSIIDSQTTSSVTCSGEMNLIGQALFTTRGGSSSYKNQFAIMEVPNGYKVVLYNSWVESVNGFGGVSRNPSPISGKMAQQAQTALENMAARLNGTNK